MSKASITVLVPHGAKLCNNSSRPAAAFAEASAIKVLPDRACAIYDFKYPSVIYTRPAFLSPKNCMGLPGPVPYGLLDEENHMYLAPGLSEPSFLSGVSSRICKSCIIPSISLMGIKIPFVYEQNITVHTPFLL